MDCGQIVDLLRQLNEVDLPLVISKDKHITQKANPKAKQQQHKDLQSPKAVAATKKHVRAGNGRNTAKRKAILPAAAATGNKAKVLSGAGLLRTTSSLGAGSLAILMPMPSPATKPKNARKAATYPESQASSAQRAKGRSSESGPVAEEAESRRGGSGRKTAEEPLQPAVRKASP